MNGQNFRIDVLIIQLQDIVTTSWWKKIKKIFEDAAVLFLFILLLMNFSDFKTHLITA